MSGKNPGLADDLQPDAALATDLGDEKARSAEQLAYLGGEADELDDKDFSAEDRGDKIEDPAAVAARLAEAQAKAEEEGDDDDATAAAKAVADAQKDDDDDDDDKTDDKKSEGDGEDDDDEDASSDTPSEDEDDADADDDDDDDDDDDEDDDDEPAAKAPKGIPKRRFDEVNERRKAAEAKLEAFEAERAAAVKAEENKYDLDAAELEYIRLVQDGKDEDALAKRKEIRAAERKIDRAEAVQEATITVDAKAAAREVNSLSTQAEELYPVFNSDHEDFDSKITGQVMAFFQGYLGSGEFESQGDAFVQAIADVIDLHDLDTKYGVTETPGDEDAKKPAAEKTVKKKGSKKKSTKKALEEAAKSPTPAAKAGEGSADRGAAVPNIAEMSEEEIGALPDATLARLRGDFL